MKGHLLSFALLTFTCGACAGPQLSGKSYEDVYSRSYSKGYDEGFKAGLAASTGGALGLPYPAAYGANEFVQAVQAGRVDEVKRLLEEDESQVNQVDNMGYSPLQYAARNGASEMVTTLLEAGADANYQSTDGFTPLKEAVVSNRPAAVEILIKAGAKVDVMDNVGVSLMQNAVESGNVKMVELLVEGGGDLTAPHSTGQPPIVSAVIFNLTPMVKYLAKHGAEVNATDANTGRTALHWAVANGNILMTKTLLDAGADPSSTDLYGNTPLIDAVAANRGDLAAFLLDAGADPDCVSQSGSPMGGYSYPYGIGTLPPLGSLAAPYTGSSALLGSGRRPAHLAAQLGNLNVLRLLENKNADLFTADHNGDTPQDLADKAGHERVVRFLKELSPKKKGKGKKKDK